MAAVRKKRHAGGRPSFYELADFGTRLKSRLDRKGWSRNTLSESTGLNGSTLWRYMVGLSSPPIDKVLVIASAVGCDPADLLPAKAR